MSADLKQTPLHDWHVARGGRMVEFGGWRMPVQFEGIVAEHHAVRQRAGLFDVSHMGEVRIRGTDALSFVQRLITNDAGSLDVGQAQYTLMTDRDGGIIDDLLVYRLEEDDFLLVVNAATTPKDVAWIQENATGDLTLEDQSGRWAQLAIQGPRAQTILSRVVPAELDEIRYYHSSWSDFDGETLLVSRTGYTGEDGFELYLEPARATRLADALLEAGQDDGLVPTGLGARDTLRLEAGMLLYGNDMDESRNPVEAGLSWVVKPEKGEFIGRDALMALLEAGTPERLVGFRLEGRGVPRHGYPILDAADDTVLGEVTSGTYSPTLEEGIGLGYVPTDRTAPGTPLAIEARGRKMPAEVVKKPFYERDR